MKRSTNDLENAAGLLDEFSRLPPGPDPTFLQVAGYAHYELVCSNLLKFFFDPDKAHGLGRLFLEVLLGDDGLQLSNVDVEREVQTQSGAKIDLVISSDSHLIGVENKIHAPVDNPFEEYSKYLLGEANGRIINKFLLTLHRVDEGKYLAGFQPVTYESLLQRLRSLLGKYLGQGDAQYMVFLADFISTMERLESGSSAMTEEQRDFFKRRNSEIQKLLVSAKAFKEELRDRVLEMETLIDVKRYGNVERRLVAGRQGELRTASVHEIKIGQDWRVCIEASLSPRGWELWLYPNVKCKENTRASD